MSSMRVLSRQDPNQDPFDRQCLVTGWDQESLRGAKVAVVGAGAIGNEALKNLALLGVGYLFVIDFDEVSTSNLSRTVLFRAEDLGRPKAQVAAERLLPLCRESTARVDWFHGDLVWEIGTGMFRRMDVVLSCVDNLEARLAVNRQCRLAGTPWVDAGMHELACHVSVFRPHDETCYECGVSAQAMELSRHRYSCDDFIRQEVAAGRAPTTQTTGALVAALQVQEAVKLLCGQGVRSAEKLFFQGTVNDFDRLRLSPRPDCMAHASLPEVAALDLSSRATLRALLEHVGTSELSGLGATLDLSGERSFVVKVRCRRCSEWISLLAPPFRLVESDAVCATCRAAPLAEEETDAVPLPAEKEILGTYSLGVTPAEILDMSLFRIGVPRLAVLPVRSAGGEYRYYELSGDSERLLPGLAAA